MSHEATKDSRFLFEIPATRTVPAGLPAGTQVAHKTCEITAVSHDGGIVYPPGRVPYVIVVLTRGVRNGSASAALIADISSIVYSHVRGASSRPPP